MSDTENAVVSKLRIEPATVAEIRQHGGHLFLEHVKECEPSMAEYLEPKWQRYVKAEEEGQLIVLGAWVGLLLVGYAVASSESHPDYNVTVCQQRLLFVTERWRHERVGLKLIEALVDEARERGCHHILMHAKPDTTLASLLPRLGFRVEETTFKELL